MARFVGLPQRANLDDVTDGLFVCITVTTSTVCWHNLRGLYWFYLGLSSAYGIGQSQQEPWQLMGALRWVISWRPVFSKFLSSVREGCHDRSLFLSRPQVSSGTGRWGASRISCYSLIRAFLHFKCGGVMYVTKVGNWSEFYSSNHQIKGNHSY